MPEGSMEQGQNQPAAHDVHPGHDIRPGEEAVAFPDHVDAGLVFIGVIRTPFATRAECPRFGDPEGPICRLVVAPLWQPALTGLGSFAEADILYWMHQARRDLVIQHPKTRPAPSGTFALRSPVRPNPIALSRVRILSCGNGEVAVRGLDCLDGTPLLDIKPVRTPATKP